MQRRALSAAVVLGLSIGASPASSAPLQLQLAGVMGNKAMLVIDGQVQMLTVGSSARGLTLLAIQDGVAQVRQGNDTFSLRVGGSPSVVGAPSQQAGSGREVVLTAGPGGHFIAGGSINGRAVSFMVDTGATLVAMSQSEAARLGVDLSTGRRGLSSTANGTVPVVQVTLNTVRLGDVQVSNVQAVVMPAQMPHILLGNSFLTRFQMRRENDVMRLELR